MLGAHPRSGLAVLGVVLAVFMALSPVVSASGAASLPDSVPRFLADAAALSVADFAYALAEGGVSAGFVILESDAVESSPGHGTHTLWHLRRREDGKPVALEDALDIFRSAHPDYEVLTSAGRLRVRARALATASSLFTKKAARVRMDALPLMSAVNRATRIADPSIPMADGVAGSVVSSPTDPPAIVADPPKITVDLAQATFVDVLDEIVGQAPGTVWLLSEHGKPPQASYYTLAIRIPNGLYTLFHDKLGAR
jgi:hypothetical protein